MRTPAMGAGRTAAVLATTVLGLVATIAAPPPTAAVFDDTELYVSSEAYGDRLDGPDPCTVTGTPTARSLYPDPGRTADSSFHDTLTVTHPVDAGDTARFDLHGRASARVVASGGRPASARMAASLRAVGSFARGAGSACASTGTAAAGMVTYFELRRPTLATMTVRTSGDIGGIYALDGPAGIVSGTVDGIPGTSRTTSRLEPGLYQLTGDFDLGLSSPTAAGDPVAAAGGMNLLATFVQAGAATSASVGAGRALVALPAARRCTPRSLTAALRSRAGRLDRVVFYVNGRRRAVVETPTAGRRVVLRSLPPAQGATVRAVLDPKQGRATSVVRRYAACTA